MARIKLDDRDAGIAGRITAELPIHDKRAGWVVKPVQVAYYAGESPEDAERFARAIQASWADHRAIEDAARKPATALVPCDQPCNVWDRSVHVGPCAHGSRIDFDMAEINALAAAFDARRGKPAADTYVAAVARKSKISGSRRRVERPAPAPAATVKAPRAATQLDPCPRCARADFRSEKGRDWHLANNPACATWRKPEKHAYALVAA